jgi:Spy/CpxP family protein refolding chaperone
MKFLLASALALWTSTLAAAAQPATTREPVTTEHYYRIKWGSAGEFKRLYKLNHQPILAELQKQGFIAAIRTDEPFTHMAGNQRWDLRVTITYRDAASAVVVGGAFDKASDAVQARLYPDKTKFEAEEAKRFSLLEEHWDVIVVPAE